MTDRTIPNWSLALPLAALLALPAACQRREALPGAADAATLQSVAMLLERGHISHHPVDDEVSRQAFDALFDGLDPLRLFLLRADVDRYLPLRERLDDELRAGDLRFADDVMALLARRKREAMELALEQLESPVDFTVDESIPLDGRSVPFAASREELAERWRLRVKLDRLGLAASGVPEADVVPRLERRYWRMAERHDDPEQAVTAFVGAITGVYDPHTVYLAPRTAEDFAMQIRLDYEGIGAVLGDEDGRPVVQKLIEGGSAAASGQLQEGDLILAVGADDEAALEPVDGMELHDIVDRIRGPRGTRVRLQVATAGAEPRVLVLERRRTELVDQMAKGEVVEAGEGPRIGWIDLPGFYAAPDGTRSATVDVARILREFQAEDVAAVVLDLRHNGGGLLSEAVSLTGLFLEGGNVVRVQETGGRTHRLDDPDPTALWTGPLVVLTSRMSASASEILAGAIQDEGRGLVVGDSTTFGKGSVQVVLDLAAHAPKWRAQPRGALKLTTQQFFRPGGASTQRHGVAADIVLPAWTEAAIEGEAGLPHALPFRALSPLPVPASQPARDPALVGSLRERSRERVAAAPDLEAVLAANRERERLRAAGRIPLSRDGYAAWRAAMSSAPDEPSAGAVDAYRHEVTEIAADYARALRGHATAP